MNIPLHAPEVALLAPEEDRARAEHYAVLARLYYAPPDGATLALLGQAAAALGQGEGALAAAWRAIGEAVGEHSPEAIEEEYTRLFLTIGRPEVMLFSSFYLAGFLMEEPLAELRTALAELGLARRPGVGDSEDHIAALCEVMRHLVLSGPDAAGVARQQTFFADQIQPWYGRLCDVLETRADALFYGRVAALTRAFFDIEGEAFEMH